VDVNSRPFTDVTTDLNGNFTGTIVAQGNGYQTGVGPMNTFQAVLRGSFTVASAGNVVLNFYDDDAFILGIGNGATRVSGVSYDMPTVTPFSQFPAMGKTASPEFRPHYINISTLEQIQSDLLIRAGELFQTRQGRGDYHICSC